MLFKLVIEFDFKGEFCNINTAGNLNSCVPYVRVAGAVSSDKGYLMCKKNDGHNSYSLPNFTVTLDEKMTICGLDIVFIHKTTQANTPMGEDVFSTHKKESHMRVASSFLDFKEMIKMHKFKKNMLYVAHKLEMGGSNGITPQITKINITMGFSFSSTPFILKNTQIKSIHSYMKSTKSAFGLAEEHIKICENEDRAIHSVLIKLIKMQQENIKIPSFANNQVMQLKKYQDEKFNALMKVDLAKTFSVVPTKELKPVPPTLLCEHFKHVCKAIYDQNDGRTGHLTLELLNFFQLLDTENCCEYTSFVNAVNLCCTKDVVYKTDNFGVVQEKLSDFGANNVYDINLDLRKEAGEQMNMGVKSFVTKWDENLIDQFVSIREKVDILEKKEINNHITTKEKKELIFYRESWRALIDDHFKSNDDCEDLIMLQGHVVYHIQQWKKLDKKQFIDKIQKVANYNKNLYSTNNLSNAHQTLQQINSNVIQNFLDGIPSTGLAGAPSMALPQQFQNCEILKKEKTVYGPEAIAKIEHSAQSGHAFGSIQKGENPNTQIKLEFETENGEKRQAFVQSLKNVQACPGEGTAPAVGGVEASCGATFESKASTEEDAMKIALRNHGSLKQHIEKSKQLFEIILRDLKQKFDTDNDKKLVIAQSFEQNTNCDFYESLRTQGTNFAVTTRVPLDSKKCVKIDKSNFSEENTGVHAAITCFQNENIIKANNRYICGVEKLPHENDVIREMSQALCCNIADPWSEYITKRKIAGLEQMQKEGLSRNQKKITCSELKKNSNRVIIVQYMTANPEHSKNLQGIHEVLKSSGLPPDCIKTHNALGSTADIFTIDFPQKGVFIPSFQN